MSRVRSLLQLLLAPTQVFVSARVRTTDIAYALDKAYGAGEYVDPEGPLNIMRGHPCVNNGMVAKQRKYAAPMRLAYSCAGDADKGDCTFTRNAHEDEVRELSGDSEAVVYLSEYYKIMKTMFTVENDVVVVDKSAGAPFCNLNGRARVELFAALLVLAGGGDIRLSHGGSGCTDGGEGAVSLVAYDAVTGSFVHVLDLESADSATLEAVRFFVKYGGNIASQVAGYGLHYTDRPSFLIQAYICELFGSRSAIVRIFKAAREIVAKLPAGDPSARPSPRFFTTDTDYVRGYRDVAGYSGLAEAEIAFGGAQSVLLEHWRNFDHGNYSDGDDSKHVVSALLKVCYCISTHPAVNHWEPRLVQGPENALRCALGNYVGLAFEASNFVKRTGFISMSRWEDVGRSYEDFLAAARASASEFITGCCGVSISAGLATDPANFLVLLAWVLGEPETELRYLQQLLEDALSDTGTTSHCQHIGYKVALVLNQFSRVFIRARFVVCTASDGARFGSLWLFFRSTRDQVGCDYVLRLAFKPEKVEMEYVSQEIGLVDERRSRLVSALKKQDPPCDYVHRFAHVAAKDPITPSLCSLIQESIERGLNPAAHRALAETRIAEAYAASDSLACHVAISRWMAHTPMQSLGEAVRAGDQQLPALEDLLARSTGRSGTAQRALTADSPAVALLGNIMGSAATVDDTLRPFIACSLRRCVGTRTDLFPSILLHMDALSRRMQEWDEYAYDGFRVCCDGYDIPEMLLRHAELRARSKIRAAGCVQGPWSSGVCLAVARCFELRYENSIRSFSGVMPGVCQYEYDSPAFIAVARHAKAVQAAAIGAAAAQAKAARAAAAHDEAARAAGSAELLEKHNFCADAANLYTAAARCFPRRHGSSSLSLYSDAPETCYYRWSVFALIAAAADPAKRFEYSTLLWRICGRWDDIFSVIEAYVLLQKTFRKLPRPGPLSPELVREVFPAGPSVEDIMLLLRIFAVFARSDRDYCGLCSVFRHHRHVLSPECVRGFVELLEVRDDAYRKTLSTITFHKKIAFNEVHGLPYAAFRDLLMDCIGDGEISAQRLLERVQDLMGVKDLLRRESSCIIC
ncbi:hypothetical protein PAPHI01_2345 [Pancytospora philotis]|nr:hypothetical protein PAPHI01_2345 [Pancytospora philotis]